MFWGPQQNFEQFYEKVYIMMNSRFKNKLIYRGPNKLILCLAGVKGFLANFQKKCFYYFKSYFRTKKQ